MPGRVDSLIPIEAASVAQVQLSLSLDAEDGSLSLLIRFTPRQAPREEMTCLFRGVRDLRFLGEPTILGSVVVPSVEDIASSGWEGIKYRVRDLEEDFVAFYCADVVPAPA